MRMSSIFSPNLFIACLPGDHSVYLVTVRKLLCKFGCGGKYSVFLSLHNLGLDFFEDIFDYNIYWHCSCVFSFLGLHIYIYMDASLNGIYDFVKSYIKNHLNCSLKKAL